MIAIVDYGLGNVAAIANIYKKLGIEAMLATSGDELERAERIILPGVGAFDWAMARLNDSGMRQSLEDRVLGDGKPILGICVGMQMLARGSEEGELQGLGWIDGDVKRFDVTRFAAKTHLPHMGWNDVSANDESGLFAGLAAGARFYFLHSYYLFAARPEQVLAVTEYGGVFAASVHAGNVYGVQFHPEKSHHWGVRLLKNFAEL